MVITTYVNKNVLFFLPIFAIGAYTLVCVTQPNKKQPNTDNNSGVIHMPSTREFDGAISQVLDQYVLVAPDGVLVKDFYQTILDVQEEKLFDQLFSLTGMAKSEIMKQTDEYYQARATRIQLTNNGNAPEYQQLINALLKNVDTVYMSHMPTVQNIPHGSMAKNDDFCINIDQTKLQKLPHLVDKFILSHELSHMIERDTTLLEVINRYAQTNQEGQQLYNKFQKFIEIRADVHGMLLFDDPECIEGGIRLFKDAYQRYGKQKQRAHPSHAHRLKVANTIQKLKDIEQAYA